MTLTVSPAKASERVQSLSNAPIYVKGLFYGDAGSGKTFLACTAPRPVLILSDYNVARPTLAALKLLRGIDPDTFFVDTIQDFEKAYRYIAAHTNDYDSVILDSVTDLNDRVLDEVLQESITKRPTHDKDQLEQGDWLKAQNRMSYWIRLFRDLPMNTFMTALVQDSKDGLSRGPMVQPAKLQQRMSSFFNLVGYLSTESRPNKPSTRKLLVDSSNVYIAKNPGGALPATVENPDLSVLVPQIMEYLSGTAQQPA